MGQAAASIRVRLRHLLAWCGPGLPIAALGLPLVVYLPPYYAGTLGLPLVTVGFIFALVRLADIPLDPLLGALMDRSRGRFGQFRPWMLAGGALLMAGTWLMFMAAPGLTAGAAFFSILLLYIGYSGVNLSQVSWGSRLSPDYGERARIFGYWTAFNVFGTLTVLLIPPVVARLQPGAGPEIAIHAMGWFILALIPLTILIAVRSVPEGKAAGTPHAMCMADIRGFFADRRAQRLLAIDLLLSVASGITGALFLFFFTAARGLSPPVASALLLAYFVAGLVAAPLWIRLARRWGKHRAVTLAGAWAGLTLLAVLVAPPGQLWVMAIGMALAGAPFAAPQFLLRAMMADLNDAQALDRYESGEQAADRTGFNFAMLIATQKLGYAIPVGLLYPLLGLIGFRPEPGAMNTPGAIRGLEILFVGPSLLLALTAAVLAWKWPITAAAHAAIRSRLAERSPA